MGVPAARCPMSHVARIRCGEGRKPSLTLLVTKLVTMFLCHATVGRNSGAELVSESVASSLTSSCQSSWTGTSRPDA